VSGPDIESPPPQATTTIEKVKQEVKRPSRVMRIVLSSINETLSTGDEPVAADRPSFHLRQPRPVASVHGIQHNVFLCRERPITSRECGGSVAKLELAISASDSHFE
jgi:hypothetical protein